jgi:hypothetical protein
MGLFARLAFVTYRGYTGIVYDYIVHDPIIYFSAIFVF